MSQQVDFEITELASTTALQRFGAPFRSDYGEVAPVDSDLPILRFIFVHHVRNFPFLDQAREKEFWQDKLQVVSQLQLLHDQESTDGAAVPGAVCSEAHLLIRGPLRRKQETEACHQG